MPLTTWIQQIQSNCDAQKKSQKTTVFVRFFFIFFRIFVHLRERAIVRMMRIWTSFQIIIKVTLNQWFANKTLKEAQQCVEDILVSNYRFFSKLVGSSTINHIIQQTVDFFPNINQLITSKHAWFFFIMFFKFPKIKHFPSWDYTIILWPPIWPIISNYYFYYYLYFY